MTQSWMGFFRLNWHCDLDARRRVALPIGADVGTGHSQVFVKVNLGLRIRLTSFMSLGIFPFNPTFTKFKDETLERKFGWWSFPTNFELMLHL